MKRMMVFGMLLLIAGCAEEKNTAQGHVVIHQEYMEPGTDELYNGERTFHNDSGDLNSKAMYVDGYPETVTHYYPTGEKKTKLVVGNDGKGEVKTSTEFYKSGQKKFEHRDNILREWYENGQLKAEVPYDENGDLHGISKTWDEDGNAKDEEEYEQGELVE